MPSVGQSAVMLGASGDLGLDLAAASQQNSNRLKKKRRVDSAAADDLGIQ